MALDNRVCFRVSLLIVRLSILNPTIHSIASQPAKAKPLAYTFAFRFAPLIFSKYELAPSEFIALHPTPSLAHRLGVNFT